MKLALILPTAYLDLCLEYSDGVQICLAQEVLRDKDGYGDFYRKLSNTLGEYVILNNGCAENILLGNGSIQYVTSYVNPNCVCLQDVGYNCRATVYQTYKMSSEIGDEPGYHRMVIAQGETLAQWTSCLEWLEYIKPEMFGVTRMRKLRTQRYTRRVYVKRILQRYPTAQIHLLGWDTTDSGVGCAVGQDFTGNIVSIDTCKPFVFAYHGVEAKDLAKDQIYLRRPENYFDIPRGKVDLSLLKYNIEVFRRAAHGD